MYQQHSWQVSDKALFECVEIATPQCGSGCTTETTITTMKSYAFANQSSCKDIWSQSPHPELKSWIAATSVQNIMSQSKWPKGYKIGIKKSPYFILKHKRRHV